MDKSHVLECNLIRVVFKLLTPKKFTNTSKQKKIYFLLIISRSEEEGWWK